MLLILTGCSASAYGGDGSEVCWQETQGKGMTLPLRCSGSNCTPSQIVLTGPWIQKLGLLSVSARGSGEHSPSQPLENRPHRLMSSIR